MEEINFKELEKDNQKYLDLFYEEIKDKYSDRTIRQHMSNVDLFVNGFLAFGVFKTMEEGLREMSEFYYFFIRKCMWSTPATCKSTAASIKKFYKCMYEHGMIEKNNYQYFLEDVKDHLSLWIEECEDYNNGNDYFFF